MHQLRVQSPVKTKLLWHWLSYKIGSNSSYWIRSPSFLNWAKSGSSLKVVYFFFFNGFQINKVRSVGFWPFQQLCHYQCIILINRLQCNCLNTMQKLIKKIFIKSSPKNLPKKTILVKWTLTHNCIWGGGRVAGAAPKSTCLLHSRSLHFFLLASPRRICTERP